LVKLRRLWRTGCHYPYKGVKGRACSHSAYPTVSIFSPRRITVGQSFADAYTASYAWVFLPEVCALQRTIDELKGTPIEERTLKRILFLPNTIALYRYRVSGIWRHDLSHGGTRPVGKFETQASIACVVWGNADHFRNILNGWETRLERTSEADTPLAADKLKVSCLHKVPSNLTVCMSSPSSMPEHSFA